MDFILGILVGAALMLLCLAPLIGGLNRTNNRLRKELKEEEVYNNVINVYGMTGDGPLTVSKPDVDSLGGEK